MVYFSRFERPTGQNQDNFVSKPVRIVFKTMFFKMMIFEVVEEVIKFCLVLIGTAAPGLLPGAAVTPIASTGAAYC
ncbi:MAG: hypothetical protein HC824_15975 [Synechococcales cyanobacterium RM1_1_8]|nr:hypothetical protein [Synechococcales cyanobacterium RM1_1_8]